MVAKDLTTLHVPELSVPFDVVVNAQTQTMAEMIGHWVSEMGLCPDPRHAAQLGMISTSCTACVYPAANGACAQMLSCYVAWGFCIDDMHDSSAHSEQALLGINEQCMRLVTVLEMPDAVRMDDDPFVRSWADVARSIHNLASASTLGRAVAGFRSYMLGSIQQAALLHSKMLPTLSEYLSFRYASGAGGTLGHMVELSLEGQVPNAEIESPMGRAAAEIAGTIMLIDNEIFSRKKEMARGEYDCSLIRVLQNENPQLSLQDAVYTTIAIRNRILEIFIRLKDRLLDGGASPEMHAYLEALGHALAGAIRFFETSSRYMAGSTHAADEPQPVAIAKLPEPPYLPDVARWERLLAHMPEEKIYAV